VHLTPESRAVPRFRLAAAARHGAVGSTAGMTASVLSGERRGFSSHHWLASGLWRRGEVHRSVPAHGWPRRSRLPSCCEVPNG
jgi:hypothetical protein